MQEALAAKPSLDTVRRLEQLLKRADAADWLREVSDPAKPK
jgi:hypothetical protein